MGSKKSPQEKKRRSYSKDRRNSYSENSKASRKNIPRRRAAKSRGVRRTVRQVLAAHAAESDVVDLKLAAVQPDEWRKTPDVPLGAWVRLKLAWRASLAARSPGQIPKPR